MDQRVSNHACFALAKRFAPEVRLHSQEKYFPCRAEWYMRRCELRYGGNGLGGQNADPAQDPVVLKRASPAKIAHLKLYRSKEDVHKPHCGLRPVWKQGVAGAENKSHFYLKIVDEEAFIGEKDNLEKVPVYVHAIPTPEQSKFYPVVTQSTPLLSFSSPSSNPTRVPSPALSACDSLLSSSSPYSSASDSSSSSASSPGSLSLTPPSDLCASAPPQAGGTTSSSTPVATCGSPRQDSTAEDTATVHRWEGPGSSSTPCVGEASTGEQRTIPGDICSFQSSSFICIDLQCYFFYGYQGPLLSFLPTAGIHEGDWEHVTLRIAIPEDDCGFVRADIFNRDSPGEDVGREVVRHQTTSWHGVGGRTSQTQPFWIDGARIVAIFYAAHGKEGKWIKKCHGNHDKDRSTNDLSGHTTADVASLRRSQSTFGTQDSHGLVARYDGYYVNAEGHPIVYSSRHLHASYPSIGRQKRPWLFGMLDDYTDDHGLRWKTWQNVRVLGDYEELVKRGSYNTGRKKKKVWFDGEQDDGSSACSAPSHHLWRASDNLQEMAGENGIHGEANTYFDSIQSTVREEDQPSFGNGCMPIGPKACPPIPFLSPPQPKGTFTAQRCSFSDPSSQLYDEGSDSERDDRWMIFSGRWGARSTSKLFQFTGPYGPLSKDYYLTGDKGMPADV